MRICLVMVASAAVSMVCDHAAAQSQSYGASPSYGSMSGQGSMFGGGTLRSPLTSSQRSLNFRSLSSQGGLGSSPFFGANRQQQQFFGGDSRGGWPFSRNVPMRSQLGGWMPQTMPMGGLGRNYPGSSPASGQKKNEGSRKSNGIRTQLRVAFDRIEPAPDKLSASLTRRLAEIRAIRCQTPIRVEVRGRTAILQGVVTTEHARDLAEQIVRLEPGIETVKNEIEVRDSKPVDQASP